MKFRIAPVLFLIASAFVSIHFAQEPSARLLHSLTDFKNPNEFLQRPGLVRISGDGKLLAVSGKSTDIIIYDLETGAVRSKIDGKGYNAFSFMPDGKTAVARDNDFELRVFDLDTGKMLRELKGVATISDEGSPYIAKTGGGTEMAPVDLSPDKTKILTVRGSRSHELVDISSGSSLYLLRNPDKTRIGLMVLKAMYGFESSFVNGLLTLKQDSNFTPDGKYVLVANVSRTATIWDVATGATVGTIGPLKNTIVNESFSPDGRFLATTDSEGITMIWSVPEAKLLSTIGSEKDSNYIAAWSPDSSTIWTIAYKEDARAYDVATAKLVMSLSGSKASGISYSPDGKYLLTKTATDKTRFGSVWNASTGELVSSVARGKDDKMPFRLFFEPNGRYLVSASQKDVKLYALDGKLIQVLENAVFPAHFDRSGQLLVTGGKKDTGYIWRIGVNQ